MNKSLSKFPILILGCGAVVLEYYLPALKELNWSKSTSVVDPNVDSLKHTLELYPGVNFVNSTFERYFAQKTLLRDYVCAVIALPNRLHEVAASLALESRLHVLCEKPLTLISDNCIKLTRIAKENNCILAVGMTRRLLPSFQAAYKALKSGLIGELVNIVMEDGNLYPWISNTGESFKTENGGMLADIGVHYLDLAEIFAGKLKPVNYSDDWQGGVETNVSYDLISEHNVPVKLQLSWTRRLSNLFILKGKQGEIIIEKDTFNQCQFNLNNGLDGVLTCEKPFSNDWPLNFHSCFKEQLYNFYHAIYENKKCFVSAEDMVSVTNLIEHAYTSRSKSLTPGRQNVSSPKLDNSKIFITGGTGFIGGHLIERLYSIGINNVVVAVRMFKSASKIAKFPVNLKSVNLFDYNQVKESIKGARYVFHLAYGKDGGDSEKVTVDGTKNVIEAAISEGVESVVVLSTIYVFGNPSTAVDESYPYKPVGGAYGRSKAIMEQYCLERAKTSDKTRIIVLNPSCVYGPEGYTYTQMPILMAKDGSYAWVEDGIGIANYTFIENLIDSVILASNCKEASGERFIINVARVLGESF